MARFKTFEEQKKIYGQCWAQDPTRRDMVIMHCPLCGQILSEKYWMRYPHKHGSEWLDPDSGIWYCRLLTAEGCQTCNSNVRGRDFYDCTEGAPIYNVQTVYCPDCDCPIGTLHQPELFGAKKNNGRWVLKIYSCRHCSFIARNWFLGPLAHIISIFREPYV